MARLGCICGADMTNTEGPSKHRLNIFYMSEVQAALSNNPGIRLWDFYTGWDELNNCHNTFQDRSEPVEYWHCTKCGGVHEVQSVSCGMLLRSFIPSDADYNASNTPDGSKELLILTDIEMDRLLTQNEEMTLSEYLRTFRYTKYFISPDEKTVYKIDKDGKCTITYNLTEKK